MVNNILGFVGTTNYDIILYLSRILNRLGKKVLLADYSSENDLEVCIPVSPQLNPEDDVITYNEVDYTKTDFDSTLLNQYDDVLIYFGFCINEKITLCSQIVYVTDQQRFHIEKLRSLPQMEAPRINLLIRDIVDSKINQTYITDRLKKDLKPEDIFLFYLDDIDIGNKILSQYNSILQFKRLSREFKDYLKKTVKNMYPDISEKELHKSYKLAERGY